jgi:purine-binding chemotaxis protein CheW
MMLAATRNGRDQPTPRVTGAPPAAGASWLVCRSGSLLAALPIRDVVETMRALPVEPVAGAPPYVAGLSIIRGAPVPVIDTALLVSGARGRAARLVTVRAAARIIALAVDEVIGIAGFAADALSQLPPLLRDAATDTIAALGALDAELVVLLRNGRIVPDDVWAGLDAQRGVS